MRVSKDAEMERHLIDKRLETVDRAWKAAKSQGENVARSREYQALLDRSAFFARLSAALLDRSDRPSSYEAILEGRDAYLRQSIDPAVVAEIQRYFGVARTPGLAEDSSPFFDVKSPGSGFSLVPRYDVRASAGHGNWATEENLVDHMAFRADFIRRTLHADPRNLVLITAIGDSMEPTIRAGDLLLVDRGVDRIIDDAIYVLVRDGEVVVKRVQQFFGGAVVVKSDHTSAYAEQTFSPDQAEQLVVAGRVRWIGRLI